MSAKLTRIHLGLGMAEIGVQFDVPDGAGGPSRQRAFVVVADAVLAPVWAAAQAALDAELAQLPLDMPPGAVTTALMQKRNALQEAERAREEQREAEAAKTKAHQSRAEAEQAKAQAEAIAVRLDEENAARAAEATAKAAALAKLDAQIAAKRAALAAIVIPTPAAPEG